MNSDELKLLMEQQRKAMAAHARSELENASNLIEDFIQFAAGKGITLDMDAFSYVQTIGVVAAAPGLAIKLLGSLPEKDGLFRFDEIAKKLPPDQFREGSFTGKDYMVMAHPYYRRQMEPMANWAPRFIELFWQLDSPNITKYIAIDEDRVRVDIDGPGYMESDTWHGAPFSEDISKIDNGIAKLVPPPELEPHYIDWFFAGAYCLDIKWSEANQIKTFQALEIKAQDIQLIVDGQTYFPARYLHAEFDLSSNIFRHFDGAVQLFTEEEYLRRRDSDFNITFKDNEHIKARSKKVFKLNGAISVDTWVEFCCQFFSANPLIFEYFTGALPENITNFVARIRENPL